MSSAEARKAVTDHCTSPLVWRDSSDIEALAKYSPDEEALLKAMRTRHVADVEDALKKPGINVNATDKWGLTPLMLALKAEDWILVPMMLETAGVDVNARTKKGFTPLMFAAWKKMGAEIPTQLLKMGANPKASIDGRTAWDVAWDNYNQDALDVFKEHDMQPKGWEKRFVEPPPKEEPKPEPPPPQQTTAAVGGALPAGLPDLSGIDLGGMDPQQAMQGLQALAQLMKQQQEQQGQQQQ